MLIKSIIDALNRHKNELLSMAQIALGDKQFKEYRKKFLDHLGREGFEGELERIITEHEKQQRNGQGQANTSKKGGVP